jgi:hypothetical protein
MADHQIAKYHNIIMEVDSPQKATHSIDLLWRPEATYKQFLFLVVGEFFEE